MRVRPLRVLEALVTPHGVDRYLELVHPMLTVRDLRAEVIEVERPTADSVTLTLRPNRRWSGFTAGQYVQLSVEIDGVLWTRCFSPCSSQHRADGRFQLTVRAHEEGLVSRHLYEHAAPGLVVGLTPPSGEFVLPADRPDRVLFVSGGSGITPVLAMLRTLLDEGWRGEAVFLHYSRSEGDVPHLAELRAIGARHDNVRLALVYTRDETGADLTGHFEPAHLAELAPWHAEAPAFVCGPQPLMAAVREHYEAKGIAELLHSEQFTLAVATAPAGDATGTIRFGGTEIENSGTTLLEQAEGAGLNPEYGCRMGICFTCTKVKTAGCTRNVRTGELHTEPGQEIQLCISVPVGDVAIDL